MPIHNGLHLLFSEQIIIKALLQKGEVSPLEKARRNKKIKKKRCQKIKGGDLLEEEKKKLKIKKTALATTHWIPRLVLENTKISVSIAVLELTR